MSKNLNSLFLDLGKQTGWVYYKDRPYSFESGSFCFEKKKYKKTSKDEKFKCRFIDSGKKFLNFWNWLEEKLILYKFDSVYFEEVWGHQGSIDAHAYGGFLAVLTMFCEKHNLKYRAYNVKTIKKVLTGNGNASKQDVIDKIISYGLDPVDSNEADAMALLYTVMNT